MQTQPMAQPTSADLKALQGIPGIGSSLARDLWDLGYRQVADLARQDAEALYTDLEALRGQPMDRCVLYAFRCAVYFAATDAPDPALLKWWNWKDTPSEAFGDYNRRQGPDGHQASAEAPHQRGRSDLLVAPPTLAARRCARTVAGATSDLPLARSQTNMIGLTTSRDL